jgi:hypothetical protein
MNEILVVALANGVWLVLIAFVMWTNEDDRKKLHALAWQALDLVRDSEKSQSALVAENLTLRHQVADAVYWIEQGNVARAKQVLERNGGTND